MGNIIRGQFRSYPDSREIETKYGVIKGRRLIHEGDRLIFDGNAYCYKGETSRAFSFLNHQSHGQE
uniref:Ala_racemase_C domain-containing protein n=1 Tax=Heterorhabditis bacteriophora TaxID=37862 RepID=A0A1I7XRX6_HETBA